MSERAPEPHTILDDAWDNAVGSMDWIKSVLYGEFADRRSLSAIVADMLVSFLPGVVIVTSARDAVAVILRMANHPERRDDLMEWVLLSACVIVIALPLAMAATGAAAVGIGAAVGGIAGSELGAALRAVMLLLIKETSKLVEVVHFLQKFIKGDVFKFLRAIKFVKYERALTQSVSKITKKLLEIVHSLRTHLESLSYFNKVKIAVIKLEEWERKFYAVQQDAVIKIPKALVELDARLTKVLAQSAPKETHIISSGIEVNKTVTVSPVVQRVQDAPGRALHESDRHVLLAEATSKPGSEAAPQVKKRPNTTPNGTPEPPPEPPLKEKPDSNKSIDESDNIKTQNSLTAEAINYQEKIKKISEKIGNDIKSHPLRQAYEAEVAGLKEESEMLAKAGTSDEVVARTMWARRREIGVKYKNLTPEPLRDYIYEVNTERYGDPLGPSFESLVKSAEKKMKDPYKTITESSSRPNADVNGLLSKFEEWLSQKDPAYIDDALQKMEH